LQDPLWKYKSNTDAKKYKEVFENKIDNIEIIKADVASKLFGSATFSMDLGVFMICENGKCDYESFSYNAIVEKVLNKMPSNVETHVHQDYKKDFSVPTLPLYGHGIKGTGWVKKIIIEHGMYNGTDYLAQKKGNFKDTEKVANVVSFNSKEEAQNYIDASRTNFMVYLFLTLQKDIHTPLKFYPFMNDYTTPWTDERFYAYFDITADEQKIIEKTVEDAKK
jgi:hypothetical protein